MKLPFIILSRKSHEELTSKYEEIISKCEELTSANESLQQRYDESRASNINLAEQVRNLYYNYNETLTKLKETQTSLRKIINENNKLKKKNK